ncbi:hypothetical protein C1O66_12915 [Paucibacter aquatile]|uniref:Uncharacterized protein n=1 Tax=Kinneretia aquatilis TaxID=2070761 RepID=A0A2N8KY00_9BURK|nr:hypothetical protein C1O66_12915 [Paucibacter aquatile]
MCLINGGTRHLRRWLGPPTGDLCAAERAAERLMRAYSRASSSDSAPLFDHSERSERREIGAAEPRSEQRGKSARRADPRTMSPAAGRDTAARKIKTPEVRYVPFPADEKSRCAFFKLQRHGVLISDAATVESGVGDDSVNLSGWAPN